jgi:rod shape-determining protein MreC
VRAGVGAMTRLRMDRKHRLLALVVALCLVSLVLDAWQESAQRAGGRTWLEGTVCAAAVPAQWLVSGAATALEKGWGAVAREGRLQEENRALQRRVTELETRLAGAQETQAQADREHRLRLGTHVSGRVARVIGWGDDGWVSYLQVAGEARVKQVVLVGEGVVGQVYATAPGAARVLPITDPASGIAARLQRSRETGILKGRGEGRCVLRYLDPSASVRSGDVVLTSGEGGVFPKGLVLGTVESVTTDREAPGRLAVVRPAAELRTLEEVVMMTGSGAGD